MKTTPETPSHRVASTDLVRSATPENIMMRRCVESTALPAGFAKLEYLKASSYPIIRKKIDGLQDPEDWLVDYLETIKILGGNRATDM